MASNVKVLIADTDPAFVRKLNERLTRAGFEQRTYSSCDELLVIPCERGFDVALVDVGLPPDGGLEACRRVRAANHCWVVILCSDRGDPFEQSMAYESGADGFFWKEHDPFLLEAQLRRVVRARQTCGRCNDSAPNSSVRELGSGADHSLLPIDFRQLTRMEERLLSMLHRSRGELVPTRALVSELWGHPQLEAKNLYDLVSVLREKLERAGWTIINHRRRGYRLEKRSIDEARAANVED